AKVSARTSTNFKPIHIKQWPLRVTSTEACKYTATYVSKASIIGKYIKISRVSALLALKWQCITLRIRSCWMLLSQDHIHSRIKQEAIEQINLKLNLSIHEQYAVIVLITNGHNHSACCCRVRNTINQYKSAHRLV